MICPKCNTRAGVYNTRHSTDARGYSMIPMRFKKLDEQFTWRAHKCPQCEHTFQSIELTTDVLQRLEDRIREVVVEEVIQQLRPTE